MGTTCELFLSYFFFITTCSVYLFDLITIYLLDSAFYFIFIFFFELKGKSRRYGCYCTRIYGLSKIRKYSFWIGWQHTWTRCRSFQRSLLMEWFGGKIHTFSSNFCLFFPYFVIFRFFINTYIVNLCAYLVVNCKQTTSTTTPPLPYLKQCNVEIVKNVF